MTENNAVSHPSHYCDGGIETIDYIQKYYDGKFIIQEYIESYVSDSPYNWMETPNVTKAIDRFAHAKYSSVGCDLAIQKIDSMNPEDVKRYLKELIKNNMKVGLQIIINN